MQWAWPCSFVSLSFAFSCAIWSANWSFWFLVSFLCFFSLGGLPSSSLTSFSHFLLYSCSFFLRYAFFLLSNFCNCFWNSWSSLKFSLSFRLSMFCLWECSVFIFNCCNLTSHFFWISSGDFWIYNKIWHSKICQNSLVVPFISFIARLCCSYFWCFYKTFFANS